MKAALALLLVALLATEPGEREPRTSSPWGGGVGVACSGRGTRILLPRGSCLACTLAASAEGKGPTGRDPQHLFSPTARALMCFSCRGQKSNFFCLKPTICSSEDSYCVTSTASLGIGEPGWAGVRWTSRG